MESTRSVFWQNLIGRPSVTSSGLCAVCGREATNAHHLIQKGLGGVSSRLEKAIPKIRLCGNGNASGCHGMIHQMLLHIYWDEGRGGYVYFVSDKPLGHELCWERYHDLYKPLPGWVDQRVRPKVYGARR